jgi:hypothetical protein
MTNDKNSFIFSAERSRYARTYFKRYFGGELAFEGYEVWMHFLRLVSPRKHRVELTRL